MALAKVEPDCVCVFTPTYILLHVQAPSLTWT